MNDFRKQLIYRVGNVLALAGAIFVGIKFITYSEKLEISLVYGKNLLFFLILLMFCGFINMLLVFAWSNILSRTGEDTSWRKNFEIYGISQISKYIPGNIFHLVSRQAFGVAAGASSGTYFKAAILELLLILTAGGLLSTFVVAAFFDIVSLSAIFLMLIISLILLGAIALEIVNFNIIYAFISYLIFLVAMGFVFVAVLALTAETLSLKFSDVLIFGSAYIFSWMIGVLTPGAPAGLGVRETVLLFMLEGGVPEFALLSAVLSTRILTAGGDVIFFVTALCLKSR